MTYVSHFRFHSEPAPSFQQLSLPAYQAARSHPDRSVKDRAGMLGPATMARVSNLHVHDSRDENLRRTLMHRLGERQYLLQPGDTVKMVGFNWRSGSPAATTGTSKINTPCLTDGMGPCIAVAVGGERGNGQPGAKARIFHVFPGNANAVVEVQAYIFKLWNAGLSVRAAMHGGEAGSAESDMQAGIFRWMFAEMNVQVDFDEACENRVTDTPLGAVIREDNSVQFVTEFVQPVEDAEAAEAAEVDDAAYRQDSCSVM